MKLDKDSFPTNKNMVKLDGKKVLVRLSRAEMIKGKDIVIGEEWLPKSPKDSQWQKNEEGKPQRCPKATFDILMAKYKEGRADIRGARKPDHPKYQTGQSDFPKSGQQLCSWELVRQMISNSATLKSGRTGLLSMRLSSDALLFDWTTNA
jgi:hypothetical protein